jgi:hypothetical protein
LDNPHHSLSDTTQNAPSLSPPAVAELVPQLGTVSAEALAALRQLHAADAFVVGASHRPVVLPAEAAGGAERLMPMHGIFHGACAGV